MENSQIQLKKLRVLVVGDNQFARALTQAMLHNIGIEMVFEARSGALAIDELSSRNLDIMLLDWQMADVNGSGVLQILRNPNFGRNFDLPTIVLADNVSRRLIERARRCGAQQIAAKPLSAKQLQVSILKVLKDKSRTHKVEPTVEKAPKQAPVAVRAAPVATSAAVAVETPEPEDDMNFLL